jgi:hypothetical protein
MTYAVPLADGSFGIAQAGDAMWTNVIYVALFSDRLTEIPTGPLEISRASAVCLSATWRQSLNRGDWPSIALHSEIFAKSAFPNERFADQGYVGAKNYDAGILMDFLSAYHGLIPWNVSHDPAYYDRLLMPELPIPSQALILSDAEREAYRREKYGVGA